MQQKQTVLGEAFRRAGYTPESIAITREDLIARGLIDPEPIPPRIPCTHARVLELDDVGHFAAEFEVSSGLELDATRAPYCVRELHAEIGRVVTRDWVAYA